MERIFTERERSIIQKLMADKTTEITDYDVAKAANEKHGDKPGVLSSELAGSIILDTEAEVLRLKEENSKLLGTAKVDVLTGLPNERALEEMLEGLESRYKREKAALRGTIIIGDATGLKITNDTLGRKAGNELLRLLGTSFTLAKRQDARNFRLGTAADEFVLHLPDTNNKIDIDTVLDRVDDYLGTFQTQAQNKYPGLKLGMSYSVVSYGGGVSPRQAYEMAGDKLGEAKTSKKAGERVGDVGRHYQNVAEPVEFGIPIPIPEHV